MTVNICFALLTTTVSGTIVMGGWWLIAKILERVGKPEYILIAFQVTNLFFLLPVSMLFLMRGKFGNEFDFACFLRTSQRMVAVSNVAAILWGSGVLVQVVLLLKMLYKQYRFCKTLLPCEVGKKQVFAETCQWLHIKEGKVTLCQSYMAEVPFLMGVIRPRVVLPVKQYSEEQLRITLTHELCHYRQKDLWVKMLNNVVLCVHFFNPFINTLKNWISLWSEFICDCSSSRELGFTKEYFAAITDMMTEENLEDMLVSGLYEEQMQLDWRIKHMLKYNKYKKLSPWKATVVGMATVVISGILLFRMTVYAADLSSAAYYGTRNEIEEMVTDDVEHTQTLNPDMPIQIIDINPFVRGDFTLTLPANTAAMTSQVKMSEGSYIGIHGETSSMDLKVKAGIGNSAGDVRYVDVSGPFGHAFEIYYDSYYYIYFENANPVDITINGNYSFNINTGTTSIDFEIIQ